MSKRFSSFSGKPVVCPACGNETGSCVCEKNIKAQEKMFKEKLGINRVYNKKTGQWEDHKL